jgi:hypothetical protein
MARPSKRPPARSATLRAALAEASWAEADVALAEALAELAGLERTRGVAQRAAALALLSQALRRAARKRGLTRFGIVGEVAAYDPARHELMAASQRPPASVRIAAPGIARGARVVAKARVTPARSPVRG